MYKRQVPGCRHIGVNEAGDVVALCGLGQWLMEEGSSPESGIMMLAATAPIEMELVDGENILYRSGSYRLTGGGAISYTHLDVYKRQAMEMCAIYRDIMSGTMDAFASIISNNLNVVMKVLTSLTVVLSIPTLFASLWGICLLYTSRCV